MSVLLFAHTLVPVVVVVFVVVGVGVGGGGGGGVYQNGRWFTWQSACLYTPAVVSY